MFQNSESAYATSSVLTLNKKKKACAEAMLVVLYSCHKMLFNTPKAFLLDIQHDTEVPLLLSKNRFERIK